MKATLLPVCIAILLAAPSLAQLTHPSEIYAFSSDLKAGIIPFGGRDPITPEVREHINQTRWRHDGTQYRRISKLEKLTKDSPLIQTTFPAAHR